MTYVIQQCQSFNPNGVGYINQNNTRDQEMYSRGREAEKWCFPRRLPTNSPRREELEIHFHHNYWILPFFFFFFFSILLRDLRMISPKRLFVCHWVCCHVTHAMTLQFFVTTYVKAQNSTGNGVFFNRMAP